MNPDTMRNNNIIHIAADHAGFEHKEAIKEWLNSEGYEVVDHGAYEFDEEDRDSYYIRGDDLSIGVVWIDNGETDSPLDAEAKANARLIAAAPEMLSALGMLLTDARTARLTSSHEFNYSIQSAEAAIAKATGESHVS